MFTTDEKKDSLPGGISKGAFGTMETPLSVGELTDYVKEMLEGTFHTAVISGEISNFKAHPSGHYYFSLKDERAQITSVMFRFENQKLKFKVHDGLKVIACGKISVYPPRGNYQIVVSRMEPEGLGALQLAFEQLKKKLESEGLFAQERKRSIPLLPKCVGIVTSSSGAAIRDILQILDRRFSGLRVLLYPVKVQGEGSAQEVATAIGHLNKYFPEIDVLIVGRGGGSIEDLWAFNEEVVARAIFSSKIPVISAVGHEVDFTIADFVADLRAPTPSAAAELVTASKLEIIFKVEQLSRRLLAITSRLEMTEMKVDDLAQRLVRTLEKRVAAFSVNLERLQGRLWRHSPKALVAQARMRYSALEHRLKKASELFLENSRWRLKSLEDKLRLLNPRTIMERGYSIVRVLPSQKVVKKASDVKMGDKLLIELSKGKITAKI